MSTIPGDGEAAKGGRPATGQVKWLYDSQGKRWCWHARFTVNGKRKPFTPLHPDILEHEIDKARACAAETSAALRGAREVAVRETVAEWFERFHAHKQARGLSTVKDMVGRARKWILPTVGAKDITAVTSEDIEAVVRRLDRAGEAYQAEGPGKGRLAPGTIANVWGDLQHAFDEAVRSKEPKLRVLKASPCATVRGPEGGDDRQGQILYSDEFAALVTCEAVPLYRRQAYAMATYIAGRASELEALTAADVDLARGTIAIAKQADRKSKGRAGDKRTKTRRSRTVDIEPNLRPLIEWLCTHPRGKGGRLLHMPPPEDRAELFRKDLVTAGLDRKALHIVGDPSERAIVFHDMRDTCLTWMAVRGDSSIQIQWRGGHTDINTTQGYLDRGRVEARRIGTPFPPLPPGLLEPPDGFRIGFGSIRKAERKAPETLGYFATPTGIEPVLPT